MGWLAGLGTATAPGLGPVLGLTDCAPAGAGSNGEAGVEKAGDWALAACGTAAAMIHSDAQAIGIQWGQAVAVAEPAFVLILGKETQSGAVVGRSIYRGLRRRLR